MAFVGPVPARKPPKYGSKFGPLTTRASKYYQEIRKHIPDRSQRELKEEAMRATSYGRIKGPDGRIISARIAKLEAEKAITAILSPENLGEAVTDDVISGMVAEMGESGIEIPPPDGGKRQRGGDVWGDIQERTGFVKAVTMMFLYVSGQIASEAVKAGGPPAVEYLKTNVIDPLLKTGSRLSVIALGLSHQLLIKAPITAAVLSASGLGYTANVVSKVIEQFNNWGERTSEYLLSDDAAIAAATAAVATTKQAGVTAVVGVAAANQLGLLPLSTLLAAIFYALQVNLGTGTGRAYVITSFYAWYVAQPAATQATIKAEAEKYGNAAKSAAKSAAGPTKNAAKAAALAAAGTLGPLLSAAASTGAEAGKNAFGVVAGALRRQQAESASTGAPIQVAEAIAAEAAVPTAAGAGSAEAVSVLESGLPAATAAAEEVAKGEFAMGVAGPAMAPPKGKVARGSRKLSASAAPFSSAADGGPAPMREGGRRKTKKVKSKRRVTRRRKATKVLGTPVFIY
jgi:hypothetical protein